ncbi:MAG TPA: hypothetical protein VD993_01065 [Chitinophagaceae bacterium]|nr:hypothetical protein [Chitinophagaceae bacterium]
MGRFLCKICLIALAFAAKPALSQEVIRQQACDVAQYKQQIDSLKVLFANAGFALVREASMTMESEYEMPIILQMQQGSLYHFVFIGEPTSKLYEVRMYDWNERQVAYEKKMWGDIDGNIINFAYTPQFTEYHMIKPVQVNKQKKKGLCGYVMLLKKVRQ